MRANRSRTRDAKNWKMRWSFFVYVLYTQYASCTTLFFFCCLADRTSPRGAVLLMYPTLDLWREFTNDAVRVRSAMPRWLSLGLYCRPGRSRHRKSNKIAIPVVLETGENPKKTKAQAEKARILDSAAHFRKRLYITCTPPQTECIPQILIRTNTKYELFTQRNMQWIKGNNAPPTHRRRGTLNNMRKNSIERSMIRKRCISATKMFCTGRKVVQKSLPPWNANQLHGDKSGSKIVTQV